MRSGIRIGQLAARYATKVETIRFYEHRGLLSKPPRTKGNYRLYTEDDAERLGFVLNCRSLQMTHDEILTLIQIKNRRAGDCIEVNLLIDEHVISVDQRIRELKRLSRQLKELRRNCGDGRSIEQCTILSALQRTPLISTKPKLKRRVAAQLARHCAL